MPSITTPKEFFGFTPGEDRRLAGWKEMVAYFELLSRESDRILVQDIGRSTEDNPFLLCLISSPENLKNVERLRRIQRALSDPAKLDDAAASDAIREARAVVAITCGIHATEAGATQMSLELAHILASSDDDRTNAILDNVMLLLVPSMNPDGLVRVKDWYDVSVGTHFEGSIPPYLYHKYTGHDNNRDWFMFTQRETRLVVEHIHNAWRPHITYDIHQTRADGMRMILPPLLDPIGPNVDPVLQQEMAALGAHMAAQLTAEGKGGVAVNLVYDSYSPSRSYPNYHGGIRILSEAASARIASPIEIPKESLREDRGERPRSRSWKHPLPWKGGRWGLREIVEYDLSASLACLDHAARNREWWVRNSYDVLSRASRHADAPYAYVIPRKQRDPSAANELAELLRFAEVELHRADQPASHEGVDIQAGDRVALMAQPFGSFLKTMMETQKYPDIRQYPGGPPRHPYDATAHCLPLKMGVLTHEIQTPFDIRLKPDADAQKPDAAQILDTDAPAYAISPDSNAAARLVNRFLFEGRPVFRASAPLPTRRGDMPPGAWALPASDGVKEAIASELENLKVAPLWDRPKRGLNMVRRPRIGIYASYVPSIEEGWTRFVFDEYGFAYTSLVDGDIREGGLSSRFDCVIIPHQKVHQLRRGFSSAQYASRFSGGLGDRGLRSLREFAERGGTLISWDDSSRLLARHLDLPVSNPLARLTDSKFLAPGSLLKIEVDNDHPIGYGMPPAAAAMFMGGPAYQVEKGETVARYSEEGTLLSGLLIGAERIAGLSALTSVPIGLGRVILFGFRPHFRAQARGGYKLLFNSVYHSVGKARPGL